MVMKDNECVFCKIVEGKLPCHKVWEDENHLAFLSIYPNTEGFSVVITKEHYPSYIFEVPGDIMVGLMKATKNVAGILDDKLDDVGRTGIIFEGFGVNHLHSKLFPMHGTRDMEESEEIKSKVNKFFDKYEGYISSHDYYKRADDEKLKKIAKKIRE